MRHLSPSPAPPAPVSSPQTRKPQHPTPPVDDGLFGRKKEDKNKETSKALKKKMEALSEEEVDRDPRYSIKYYLRPTPEGSLHSIQDIEDDDSDPNYARINFNTSPSPRTTSFPPPLAPEAPHSAPSGPYRPPDDLEGLYAKVNKPHHQALSESEPPRHQGQQRRENQPARPAPAYEELDLVRRRGPEPDPPRCLALSRGLQPPQMISMAPLFPQGQITWHFNR
ncbi:unnamed protein product [Lota lota]